MTSPGRYRPVPPWCQSLRTLRISPEPLLEYAREREWSIEVMALRFGVSARTVLRWADGQYRITMLTADRVAVQLGLHPCEIWPDWFDLFLEEAA